MTPEGKVKKDLYNYIEALASAGAPIYYEVRQAGGFNYHKGIPDFYIVYKGRHIEIEVKKPGGTQSNLQIRWQTRFTDLQIPCYCISSVSEFVNIINEIDK